MNENFRLTMDLSTTSLASQILDRISLLSTYNYDSEMQAMDVTLVDTKMEGPNRNFFVPCCHGGGSHQMLNNDSSLDV